MMWILIVLQVLITANETSVCVGDEDDDEINECGNIPGEDEDDHDPAGLRVVDLALTKTTNAAGPFRPGDLVNYTITVCNQGNVEVDEIQVFDNIPTGLAFHESNFPLWIYDSVSRNALATFTDPLLAGNCTSMNILLEVQCALDLNYPTAWDNYAEIYSFEDSNDNDITSEDIDSNADAIFNNDAGGQSWCATDDYVDGDGTGFNGNCIAETDEDDHDPERIEIFDLALKKELVTFNNPYKYGQLLEFEITVCNQGNIGAQNVVLRDYLPAGFNFDTANNPEWSAFGTDATTTVDAIAVNTCETISIFLTTVQTTGGEKDWVNYAEIISAMNENGEDRTDWDFDSTPGSNGFTENQVEPDHAGDNDMLSKDRGGEEDDHDPAGIELLDLALKKTTFNQVGPFCYGDQIFYSIEICNQGSIQADNIQITDYIPCGFEYDDFNDFVFWTYDSASGNATRDFVGTLDPGQCITTAIFLNLQQCIDNDINTFTNFVEISQGLSTDPDYPTITDVDSNSDIIETNDIGGTPDDPLEDDVTTGDSCAGEDEDDHDPERVEVFDLALKQELVTINNPYKYGQLLQFDITVCNQGNLDAQNIAIQDFLPAGLSFDANENPDWLLIGATPIYVIPTTLIQDECITFPVYLRIEQTTGGEKDWVNYTEIISATDTTGTFRKDADSNPNSNSAIENSVEPDHAGDDDLESTDRGGEEDDHDPAGIELLDLALRKTTINQYGPFCYGEKIAFDLEICNQGSIQADQIRLTDYIPCGFTFDPSNIATGWTHNSLINYGSFDASISLDPGDCFTETIYLIFTQCIDQDPNTFTNFAEITQGMSTDPDYPFITDVDSNLDFDNTNDVGGTPDDPTEDNVITGDSCAGEDEDDHDPERVEVFDLALIQELVTINDPYKYGQLLKFDMTVCNQGNLDAQNIRVENYLPVGFGFDITNNPEWMNTGGTITYDVPGVLIQDQCRTFPIFLTIEQTTGGEKDWVNYAEIVQSTDLFGVDRKDADSVEGSNLASENAVEPGHDGDDDIESTDLGGEEDDHDPAGIELLDLALRKTLVSTGPFKIKSEIEFEIEVFNQGSIQTSDINLIDYIPCGLIYNTDSDANGWGIPAGQSNATFVMSESLVPGGSFTTRIKFDIRKCDGQCINDWTNYAEIWSQQSDDIDYPTLGDVDSNTDANEDNDLGGSVSLNGEDDFIHGDACANEDEDDHDPELVPVYDLALQKRSTYNGIDSLGPFRPGDVVEFHIEIHNQGSLSAINTQVTDYLNYGFDFDPGINPGWVLTGDLIQYTITDPILPCGSRLLKLNLEIISPANATVGDWYNEAEISGGTDNSGTIDCDADSTPDTNPDNDNDLVDGPDDDVVFNLGDENDEVIDEHIGDPCDRGDDDEDDNDAAEVLVVGDLCGFVWNDCNGDGIQNDPNSGMAGVVVEVYDQNAFFVGSVMTSNSGYYELKDLLPGNYFVKIIKPGEYLITDFRQGNNLELDSDINNSNGACTSPLAYVGGGNCDAGDFDAGLYECIPIGEFVWYDINENDQRDSFENGINGIPVQLWQKKHGVWSLFDEMQTTHKPGTPSDDGYFKFCAPPGEYEVRFDIPDYGLVPTVKNVGSQAGLNLSSPNESILDSDVDFSQSTGSFIIDCNIDALCNIGAGYYPQAQVGNRVWLDDNGDGLQSSNEMGVAGVVIEAYNSNNDLVNSVVTNADGAYNMDYLGRDDYYFKLLPPVGMGITQANMGSDDMDSDFENIFGANTTNMMSLNPGDNLANVDAGLVLGVVPVEWLYINAENREEHNLVEWATASEVNMSHFELERSLGNIEHFVQIGENISSNSPINGAKYQSEDQDLAFSGTYYYRVKQVDVNGSYTYSEVVSLRVVKTGDDVGVFPNPTERFVNVELSLSVGQNVEINIFDSKGSLVRKSIYNGFLEEGNHDIGLDLEQIPSGNYNISIQLDNTTINKKIVKL